MLQHACDTATQRYTIEYSRERVIDRLFLTIQIVTVLVRVTTDAGAKYGAEIMRLSEISQRLRSALTSRFEQLRGMPPAKR